jgi:hypothetical protein
MKSIFIGAVMAAFSATTFAQSSEVKVISVGPAVGPIATYAQAFAKNIKGANSYVAVKDCAAAVKLVESTPNSVYLLPHDLITTARKMRDRCFENIDHKNVVVFSEQYYDFCKLPDNKTTLTTPGVKLGRASVHPVKEWGDDFNRRNNASIVSIGLSSSVSVRQALMAKDIDWGVIVSSISVPAMKTGQIVCPFSTNVDSPRSLSKSYFMKINNFPLSNIMVANTKDPAVMKDLRQAARSPGFQEYLKSNETSYQSTDVTKKDMQRFTTAVEELYEYMK